MHDPVRERDELVFDFGVTALGAAFHQDWALDADTASEHVVRWYGAEGDPGPVLLLVEDLLRLRDSGLTGSELGLLWRATDVARGAPDIGGVERAALEHVLALVVPLARARGASAEACASYPACVPDGASAAAVEHRRRTAEVEDLAGLLSPAQPATRDAVVRCAGTVCAELAFRFLLCAVNTYSVSLAPATYGRLEGLAAAFGHGPYVVDAVRYLVG